MEHPPSAPGPFRAVKLDDLSEAVGDQPTVVEHLLRRGIDEHADVASKSSVAAGVIAVIMTAGDTPTFGSLVDVLDLAGLPPSTADRRRGKNGGAHDANPVNATPSRKDKRWPHSLPPQPGRAPTVTG